MPQTDDTMHVACCFDEAMLAAASVLAASIAKFSDGRRKTIFHAYHVGDIQMDFEALSAELKSDTFEVLFERISNNIVTSLPTNYSPNISLTAFARFMVGDLLPDCNRIIYLDADTIVLKPLAPLFDLDLDSKCIAAIVDPIQHIGWIDNELPGMTKSYLKEHANKGIADLSYFNIGVLLIDLDLWRETKITERLRFPNSLLSDQDALNELIGDDFVRLDERWNTFAVYAAEETTPREAAFFGAPGSFDALVKWRTEPWIVHFAGHSKPWKDLDQRTGFDTLFWNLLGSLAPNHPVLERMLRDRRRSIEALVADKLNKKSRLPLVSVIVVNHNYGRFLKECVKSILDQSYPEIECIIVDNRSTDESADRIKELLVGNPSIKVVWSSTNEGQCVAMQKGFALATGSYTVFVDADDFLLEHFVGIHVDAHLALTVPVGFTSSDMLQLHGRKIMGNIGLAHHARSKPVRPEQCTNTSAADTLSRDFFFRYRGSKPPMRLASRSAVEWMWSPTSGSVYRSDAVRLFFDNPALKDLTLAGDAYLNYGINSLVGSALLDRALSVYRVHDSNNFTRSVSLSGVRSYLNGEDNSPQAAYFAFRHIIENYDDFSARVHSIVDLSTCLSTLYRKANGNKILIMIDRIHARWAKINWQMRLRGMTKKRRSQPAGRKSDSPDPREQLIGVLPDQLADHATP